jgi:methionine aminopeptidase
LGAHVDGYIGTSATTTVVNENTQNPITGKAADVVCATHFAYEVATRMLRPGVKVNGSKGHQKGAIFKNEMSLFLCIY